MQQEKKDKSQLAKDLSHALFVCRLRDNLAELVDDSALPAQFKKAVNECYLQATVVLVCAMVDSKNIRAALGGD